MIRAWIAVLLLVGCGGGTPDPAAQAQSEADAGIIRAVIQHRMKNWRHEAPRAQEILVVDTMAAQQSSQHLDRARAEGLGWGRSDTWEAFFAANTRRLGFVHGSTDSFTLISRGRVEPAYHQERHCGVLCKNGWVRRLVLEDGMWKLVDTLALWIS